MNRLALYTIVVLAPLLAAATVTQGHLYGWYKDDVYTAPGKLFRMTSPFPDEPVVSDGRDPGNNNAGAVSFIDAAGRMLGVLYMENQGKVVVPEGAAESRRLADWFRDVGFPGFFRAGIPDAKILRDEAGEIAGQPAWIAVAHVPNASPLGLANRDGSVVQRNDSWRGIAVVGRGKHYYLLQTELRVEKFAGPDWRYDADTADWNVFVPELEALYQRIEFLKP